ncbi:MAG: phosphoenolpyruvate--protein phosphotransferase [bacterium]
MRKVKCITASPGYAVGPAFLLPKEQAHSGLEEKGTEALNLLEEAKERLRGKLAEESGMLNEKEGEIFLAHALLLEDPEIWERIKGKIKEGKNLGVALQETEEEIVFLFQSLNDERFRTRADDVKDIIRRIKETIKKGEIRVPEGAIIVGEEILPSHIVEFLRGKPKGFISESGSPYAHAAIIARAKKIPMLTSCKGITEMVRNGEILLIDAENSEVIINPTVKVKRAYLRKEEERKREEGEAFSERYAPAITKNGREIKVLANVGNIEEMEEAKEMGADGIGIFRTEFLLFRGKEALAKKAHLEVYKEAGRIFYPKPVHIRLFDIGADKPFPFLQLPPEPNPALGLRGIRLLLKRKELLLPQLEAIVEAHEEYPNLSIILPMVSFLDEIRMIKEMVNDVPVGIMVETPACALLVSKMAELCDYFSIGTNDLLQYTLAVDRAGKNVSELYNPYHPALWKLVRFAVKEAKRKGKEIGVCGEIAAERAFIPRLIKLGVDHLSVSPRFIPIVKKIIRSYGEKSA